MAEKGNEKFYVLQGSYDSTEICELLGLYLLHRFTHGKKAIFDLRLLQR